MNSDERLTLEALAHTQREALRLTLGLLGDGSAPEVWERPLKTKEAMREFGVDYKTLMRIVEEAPSTGWLIGRGSWRFSGPELRKYFATPKIP